MTILNSFSKLFTLALLLIAGLSLSAAAIENCEANSDIENCEMTPWYWCIDVGVYVEDSEGNSNSYGFSICGNGGGGVWISGAATV